MIVPTDFAEGFAVVDPDQTPTVITPDPRRVVAFAQMNGFAKLTTKLHRIRQRLRRRAIWHHVIGRRHRFGFQGRTNAEQSSK
jgi:hypothetical protein